MAFADHSIIDKKMNACSLVPGIESPVLHGGPGGEGTVEVALSRLAAISVVARGRH